MGVAISGTQYLWPGRIIPYVIDPQVPDPASVEAAIVHWNQTNIVRFVERAGEVDYVLVTRADGTATSDIGHRGNGEQRVSLADNCPVGSIIHEFGHTLGLWHEHCRHKRDDFVDVLLDQIAEESLLNFTIDAVGDKPMPTFNLGDYDFGSIMHYEETACAFIEGTPVLIPKQPLPPGAVPLPPGVVQGQRDGLSPGDIASVAELYQSFPPLAGPAPAAGGPIIRA
jgi:hypothetical protein